MKTTTRLLLPSILLIALSATAAPVIVPVTYQGRLTDGGSPANGVYDLRFAIHIAGTGPGELAAITNVATVEDGLFTTLLDLDVALFPEGDSRWLEIGVRTNGSADDFTLLAARQQLTFTPYAIRAFYATVAENVAPFSVQGLNIQNGTITAEKIDAGQVVKSINGLHDEITLAAGANTTIMPSGNTLTIAGSADWRLTGNAGTIPGTHFLGTTDNQPLELRVNGIRAFRLVNPTMGVPQVIGGSLANGAAIDVSGATIAGGYSNTIANAAYESTIGGGAFNTIQSSANQSTLGGGAFNTAGTSAEYTTISGGRRNTIGNGARYSTISGGSSNHIAGSFSSIAGGRSNLVSGSFAAVTGGGTNVASGDFASVGGGDRNLAGGLYATVAGGSEGQATGDFAFVGAGIRAVAAGFSSTVAGGTENSATGDYSSVPGGAGNAATGAYSLAAGRRAKVFHHGTFAWADSSNANFESTSTNQFLIRAGNGVGINTAAPAAPLHIAGGGTNSLQIIETSDDAPVSIAMKTPFRNWRIGQNQPPDSAPTALDSFFIFDANVSRTRLLINTFGQVGLGTNTPTHPLHLASGAHVTAAGVWTSVSDRAAKEEFTPVDPREVLARVAALPIMQWKYKVESDGVKHIGPTAQDFRAAFGLGESDTAITSVDADGVALAAIKGLNQRLEERDSEIAGLKRELRELREQIQKLSSGGAQ